MKISSHKELVAYKKSYEVVKLIYELTKGFPQSEIYGITSQIRRSAVSIPSNIAEGYMRGSKEYVQFLKIALGSAAELDTQICICNDLGFFKEVDFNKLNSLVVEVMKLLTVYIKKLKADS
ncbi:MAG: four helix bundle protein [Candidatus Omnitrophica bacterium]|nr:four helix bundle protein [Candidatus Omnitrophota bacterium]